MKSTKKPARWPIYATTAAVCAAVTIGAYVTALEPALARREAQRQLQADLLDRRQKLSEIATGAADARRQLDHVNDALSHSDLRLQPASLVNDRIERLADLANECGLTIDEVHPGEMEETAHFQTVSIKLAGTGEFPACAKFLHQLHDTFPDTGVRSLETVNTSPNPLRPVATFHFELTWYAAPAGASVAKTE